MLETLRNKIVFLACFIAFATSLFIGGISYVRIVQTTTDTAIESLAGETRLIALQFKDAYDQMRNDVFVVANTPPINGLIRSMKNEDVDPVDGSTSELWKQRLETIFISVMDDRPHYTQMRYIGVENNGLELVRVNRIYDGYERVPEDRLQNKAQEPYFKLGKQLKPDQFYFSEVTYNREFGQITEDLIPTVRFVLPIYNDAEEFFGLLVVNADYDLLLRNQFEVIKPDKKTLIVNHSGDYIAYDPEKGTSPLELSSNYTIPPPDFVSKIQAESANEQVYIGNADIAYFNRLTTDPNNDDAYLGVVLEVNKDRLLQGAYKARRDTLILSCLLIVATLIGTYMVTAWFTRPLEDMTEEIITADKNKQLYLDLPVDRKDEIGDLARAFDSLTKDLVDSQTKVRSFVKNAMDGIITIDHQGIVESFNPASEKMFGYTSNEVIGQNVNMLMPEPYHTEHDGYIHNYVKTGEKKIIGMRREVRGKRKDGSSFPLDLSISETRLDKERLFTGVVRDITDRQNAEAERERLISELEISNQELDNFAYVASHDLKAPLRVIDNASQWLEEDLSEYLDDDTRESMDMLRSRVKRMEKLLDDLLEYSRIGRTLDDRFEEKISGKALLENIRGLLSPPPGFVISGASSLDNITVNRMPLQQIILNLVSNAIKHHDKDQGTVVLSVEEEEDNYIFSVKDDGPGIPEEFHEKVFKMFQTLKPRDQVEGSGMGLAMVYKNVEIYGGKIRLKSREEQGCEFEFSWPKIQSLH